MEDDGATHGTPSSGIAINQRYYAYVDGQCLHVHSLCSSAQWTRKLHRSIASAFQHAIAFSEIAQNRLAISIGDRILIFDGETGVQMHVLSGAFRVITTLGWANHDPDVLAAGALMGRSVYGRCSGQHVQFGNCLVTLAFNRLNSDIIAIAHGTEVAIWSRKSRAKPIQTLSVGQSRVIRLAWHRVIPGRLLTATNDDNVRIWELSQIIIQRANQTNADDEIFGELEDVAKCVNPIANLQYGGRVRTARWLGEHGLVVLAEDEDVALCYSFGADWEMLHEVWRLKLDNKAVTMVVHHRNGGLCLTCVSEKGSESHRIPAAVMDSVGGDVQWPVPANLVDSYDFATASHATQRSKTHVPLIAPTAGIAPMSISALRKQQRSVVKTSKQLQQRCRTGSDKSKHTAIRGSQEPVSTPATPSSRAMTASLELPKAREALLESPMPFISPTIPAKKPSTHTIAPIEESLEFPPLRHASIDTMASSDIESDSDDESFAHGMRGSGTLLPGGINVPLPKTCGALFTPSGELVTFFKKRPRPPSPAADKLEVKRRSGDLPKASKVVKLFATFGNLVGDDGSADSDSASSDSERSELGRGEDSGMPGFSLQSSPYRAGQSWSAKFVASKPDIDGLDGQHTFGVSLYALDLALVPCLRSTAGQLEIFRGNGKTGKDVCHHNAAIAEQNGQADAAHIWCLVAILLDDTVPLQLLAAKDGDQHDLLTVVRKLDPSQPPMPDTQPGQDESLIYGRLRWADSPLGRDWAIRQILEWAERRADVQMLAYFSAFMTEAHEHVPLQHPSVQQMLFTELPSFAPSYELPVHAKPSSTLTSRPMPILRTSSYGQDTVHSSPVKLRQNSQASSRTNSQPTTPFLDSNASTPPPILYMSRQGSKLSASGSGSASPEYHRSSFGAAARHYAQSITDKFAQYGTSPPVKKLSASPSTNELSTSLPAGSSSWSKSVSFASTLDRTRDGRLSRSYASNDDGYDSERTIDDTSQPHTPKSMNAPIGVKLLNQGAFSDSASGCAKVPLLPPDLAAKAVIWRHYYAERLRCWDLPMQAAELEKVSGLTGQSQIEEVFGVCPEPESPARFSTCTICSSLIRSLAHSCPGCLHTAHVSCLNDYLFSLDDDPYECPAGCGCQCSDPPAQAVQFDVAESEEVKSSRTVHRKRSFTDPERWRARVEAESL
ncbi:Zinc-ribbon, C4HC2 type [Teratosphaeria destructans]|uniref:Zinc-ribbon, C4HC2 type n=1 Tax=Teratosphaeria destructans TaxID=418781 RepID=A0A9W7T2E3_9PEZI|nr:Zinc-ribbon, C4HC2 type [Teratosphaeria destructans]